MWSTSFKKCDIWNYDPRSRADPFVSLIYLSVGEWKDFYASFLLLRKRKKEKKKKWISLIEKGKKEKKGMKAIRERKH